eukprot:COSAG04_NODE_3246_length_3009_cov_13.038288_3_plen_45_part_00
MAVCRDIKTLNVFIAEGDHIKIGATRLEQKIELIKIKLIKFNFD